jgi:hypothetical protein
MPFEEEALACLDHIRTEDENKHCKVIRNHAHAFSHDATITTAYQKDSRISKNLL